VRCVDLRRAPWRTATASAACHGGPPRALLAGSARGHHGRARGGVQRRWYPAPAVPPTCGTPHPRTPASRAASAAGIHVQERFELSYLGQGRLQRVDRVSAFRRPPRVSTSLRLGLSLSVSLNPNRSASLLPRSVRACFGAAAWRRGGRRAAAAGTADSSALGNLGAAASTDLLCPPIQPPPLHFVGSSNLHAVAEESILLHQTPSEVTNLSIAATSRSARMLWTQIISL